MPEARPLVVVGSHVPGLFMHVDSIPGEGETVLAWGFDEPEDGGKATNQAVAAAKLDAPVRLVTLLGDDERGERWRRIFVGYGIDVGFVLEVPGPTDVGFVLLPPSRIPAIASAVERSRGLGLEAVRGAREAFEGAFAVICQLEAPQECAIESFRIARAVGALTLLNPAPAAPLDPELFELTDLLIPNEHEAAALVEANGTPAELAAELGRRLAWGAVIVTAGADGCYLVEQGAAVVHVPAVETVVEDTTGAGDAFIGALAVSLRTGATLREAAGFAVRAASVSVGRAGTMPSFATADEAGALMLAAT